MPNQPFRYMIDNFIGLNTYSSETNLKPGECTQLQELTLRRGKLVLLQQLNTKFNHNTNDCRWMKVWADSNDNFHTLVVDDDGTNSDLHVYDVSGGNWSLDESFSDLYVSDKTSIPGSFSIGGELRIGGSLTNYHKYIKYYSQEYRLGTDSGDGDTSADAERSAGLYMDNGEIDHPNSNSEVTFTATEDADSTSDFINGDEVEYAMSYTYDNAQESLLYSSPTETLTGDGHNVDVYVKITPGVNDLSWRVTHVNIYRALNDGDFYLLTRIQVKSTSQTKGYGEIRTGGSGSTAWAWTENGTDYGEVTVEDDGRNLTESYTARTGFSDSVALDGSTENFENSLKCYWGEGVVCQGRAVVGNVKRYVGEYLETYNDRLYFSSVGRFDSFYKNDWVDIETGDGDLIIRLTSFGSDVLVFKRNNLYVWNMGTRDKLNWYLKAKYPGYGVEYKKHVFKTPYGVAFWNGNGVFLYNGQITELGKNTVRNDVRSLTSSEVAVGFDGITKQLLVTSTSSGELSYQFDLDDGYVTSRDLTGGTWTYNARWMDNYINGELFYLVYQSSGDLSPRSRVVSANIIATTLASPTYYSGRIDLGSSVKKRIERIRVRYKSVKDGAIGGTGKCSLFLVADGTSTDIGDLDEATSYTTKEFYPGTYCTDFQIGITGDSNVYFNEFELDSIEIEGKVYEK